MALLTIQEPERSLPKKQEIALGIDLGTTHSLVGAYLDNDVVLFQDTNGSYLLPSVVLYPKDQQQIALVGHQAIEQDVTQLSKAIYSIKRFMGKALSELNANILHSSDALQADENNLAVLSTLQGIKSPVQVSAEILKKLIDIARLNLKKQNIVLDKEAVIPAVITVPAYFDDGQRQATKAAAELSGLKVLRLLNEPTAAALAYGADKQDKGTYLVYDLGGGTFDVSILGFRQGIFEVLATAGDTALGGDDMDACLMEYLKQQVKTKSFPLTWQKAREIKELLTTQNRVDIVLNDATTLKHPFSITQACFEELIQPLIEKTIHITEQCIQDAKIPINAIDKIFLVGGATRVPAVYKALNKKFGLPISQEMDPDKVVAMGAVLQAAKLTGHTDSVLLDVVPLSLGIELMGGVTEKIIARNTKLPVTVTQSYTTYQDNQTGFKIHVVQGERELVKDNRSLAQFELLGLPALPQGKLRIEMMFTVDVDGLLTVTAKESSTSQFHKVEVKPTYGLTQLDIDAAILKAAECAKKDISERQFIEAKREADKLIDFANNILSSLNEPHVEISQSITNLLEAIDKKDNKAIKAQTKHLEEILTPISLSRLSEVLSV